MAKFSYIKNNVQAGQLSPKLKGRTDIQEYPNGCELIKNMFPMPEGGASKRSGTLHQADILADLEGLNSKTGYTSGGFRLIPFVRNDVSYTIAIGDMDLYEIAKNYDQAVDSSKAYLPIAIYKNGTIESSSGGFIEGDASLSNWIAPSLGLLKGTTIDKDGWSFHQQEDYLTLTHSSCLIQPIVFRYTESYVAVVGGSLNIITTPSIIPSFYLGFCSNYTALNNSYRSEGLGVPFQLPNLNTSNTINLNTGLTTTATAVGFKFNVGMSRGHLKVVDGSGVEGLYKINPSGFQFSLTTANYNSGTDRVVITGHKVQTNDPVVFTPKNGLTGSAVPSGIVEGVTYYAINVTANDFQLSATSGGSSVPLTDVGSGNTYMIILESSTANLTAEVAISVSGTFSDYALPAWDGYNQGWPSVCGGYQQRNILAGTLAQKGSLWFSRVSALVHFMQRRLNQDVASATDVSLINFFGDLADTDPFTRDLSEDVDSSISWMQSKRNLHVGTLFAEYIIGGSDGIFGPTSVFASKQTDYGSKREQASGYGNASLFISRNGKSLRDFRYSENNGSNVSRNLSVLSDQILYSGFTSGNYHPTTFKSLAWNNTRSILFLLNSLGSLITITLEDSSNTTAWAEQDISGAVAIHGVCVIPNVESTYDDVYLNVERVIDGTTVQYLEKLERTFEHPVLNNTSTVDEDKAVFLDSALVQDLGASGTAVTGLDHLEGETVRVVGDGEDKGTYTVASGAITLTSSARYLIIGLDYESDLITMPIEAGSVTGSSQSYLKRVDQLHLKLFRSVGGKYGFGENLYDIEYPDHSEDTFTGHIKLDYDSTNDYEYAVRVKHTSPFPFNLLSMNMRGNTEE